MTSGEVQLCNRALRMLRAATLISLAEESETARACRSLFAPLRDEVLRAYPWNFAMARASLAAAADAPAWGFARAFPLPEEPVCLRVWRVEDEALPGATAWRVEGRQILSDAAPPLRIVYVARVADTSRFDPCFASALAARLAAELAYPLTGSSAKEEGAWRFYERALSEARRIDAQEGSPESFSVDTWLQARF